MRGIVGSFMHVAALASSLAVVSSAAIAPGQEPAPRPRPKGRRRRPPAPRPHLLHPHSSTRQRARYARQIAAGQLSFRSIVPTNRPGPQFRRERGL